MSDHETEHDWFARHAVAYVTGGLSADDRARLESHASACAACRAELSDIQKTDQTMSHLFAGIVPAAGFEDSLVERLNRAESAAAAKWKIGVATVAKVNPMVRRAAVAAAAAIVLGGFGYAGSQAMRQGKLPILAFDQTSHRVRGASDLTPIAKALESYTSDFSDYHRQNVPASVAPSATPAEMAKQSNDGTATVFKGAGVANGRQSFVLARWYADDFDFNGGTVAARHGAVGGSRPESGKTHKEMDLSAPSADAAQTRTRREGQNLLLGDGQVDFVQNPFAGVAKDRVITEKSAFISAGMLDSVKLPADTNAVAGGNVTKDSDGDGIADAGKYSIGGILIPPSDVKPLNPNNGYTSFGKTGVSSSALSVGHGINSNGGVLTLGGQVVGTDGVKSPAVESGGSNNLSPPTLHYFTPGAVASDAAKAIEDDSKKQLASASRVGNGSAEAADQKPPILIQREREAEQFPLLTNSIRNGSPLPVLEKTKLLQQQLALADGNPKADVPPAPTTPPAPPPEQQTTNPAPAPVVRKVIRNGEMEFEVDSFDSAFLQVTRIVAEDGGYVGTTNSQKLPNGKVSGTLIVRVAPDRLDVLVLKLRALGELKGQRITAQDVTKEYTDLGSELRADRAMEARLLDIIKDGKGAIKDLLAAEKELGEWRTKIEKIVGQMNYYDSLVSLSTLQLTLTEKDIKTPALASQSEKVDMGIETEDVEKARADAIKAVDEAKGQIVASDLKQHEAGQLAATIVADVAPDAAGPVIDRLKQLGKVARLDVSRAEVTTDGHGNVVSADTMPAGLRVEKKDTRLSVSLYNLANVAPRQTANVELACDDVEASYHTVLDRVAKANGRVIASNLLRPKPDQVTGSINFEVKSADADAVLMDVRQAGEVMQLNVTENPDTNNVTTTKRGFSVQLRAIASVNPREVRVMHLATSDVPAAYAKLLVAIKGVNARILLSKLDDEQGQQGPMKNQMAGWIDFEVKRADLDTVDRALAEAGETFERQVTRAADEANTLDTKVQIKVGIHNAVLLPSREVWTIAVESGDVEGAQADVLSAATGAGGRIVDSTLSKEANGRTTARMVVEVPFDQSAVLVDRVKREGEVRVIQSTKNPQAPEGKLARSRLEVTIGSPEAIVSGERGLWGTIRAGLTTSVAGLLWSLQLIVVGLCFVGPWVAAIWVGWRFLKRRKATD